MLRSLLEERFQLRIHHEIGQGPVYALTLAKGEPKLVATADVAEFPFIGYGRTDEAPHRDFMVGFNASMDLLANRLSREFERPVVNRTGLSGAFDFRFEYVKELSESAEGASIFTAIQGLGLKLAQGTGPVERIVIDGAERPSGN